MKHDSELSFANLFTSSSQGGSQCAQLETSSFLRGELRTDDVGRLLVLGGKGKAESLANLPTYNPDVADSVNNADGWYDDTSDGPISATVEIGGRKLTAKSAWVIVAPPNFAPDVIGWRTMYDLLLDVHIADKWLPVPSETSFANDVPPVLSRLTNLQWVNKASLSSLELERNLILMIRRWFQNFLILSKTRSLGLRFLKIFASTNHKITTSMRSLMTTRLTCACGPFFMATVTDLSISRPTVAFC